MKRSQQFNRSTYCNSSFMKALILAGGFGTRLAHVSGGKPKPLVEVAGKPILERHIEHLRKYGLRDIRLSLYHKADQIVAFCENRWPGQMEFMIEPEPLGTGGGIKFAAKDWNEPYIAVNGDTLSNLDIHAFLAKSPNTILCAYREDARDFGLLQIENGRVAAFLEKPKAETSIPGYINAGMYLLHPDVLRAVQKDAFMMEQDVFPQLAASGGLYAHLHHGYWIDVGTEERLMQAHKDFAVTV